ncbi:PLP-dependent aminotransferase family protein [Brevibacillus borstelensis]|uniref:MocR-like pyridoxine biosynthesis transcription factor PdxR n=1 Tax=Brevibacillus borstelensis TaxID=45462 RepID=UPI000F099AB0|nr:PLP-dependent aminotransferase family protein [Brevibacillus borstelensis]MBE5394731.1 PLP-dependent aminotransferase family protein [Brevibacillus borstelensis]MCC0566039.1 PLP-dependent aminotransferase family protein [Brevibacillus borstelensis]MCM3469905.1 PLP-dependent aminotransferase family protein [Brevibacillus borstelensis]MCM3560256.1 PLP-dependent aminotransferase family protein [Brevibacillus borstelensis]MCM3590272.1 PLP-dependent aminotransferase family protein [Brevibacillus
MLWINIDRTQPMPLFRQLYADIRGKILKGELRAGERLPSTRKLAEELYVSRNVVLEAYDQLLAEGYLEGRPGSGHYVAPGIDLSLLTPLLPPGLPLSGRVTGQRGPETPERVLENDDRAFPSATIRISLDGSDSAIGRTSPGVSDSAIDRTSPGVNDSAAGCTALYGSDKAIGHPSPNTIDFRSGVPCLDRFPRALWGKIMQQVCREAPLDAFGYGRPEGQAELRAILSRYLFRTRGVQCRPEQIVITSGATQAFVLIAKVLLSKGASAVIEDPITRDIQTIFAQTGAALLPVPVDQHGMMTNLLPADAQPRFVLVTPSHQFPLGGTLPIQRRIQLIRYASERDCYLVEDDYDSEFRYDSPPVHSLQGLAGERVIYIGSFSKILSPGLRMGYLVLPPSLVERYQAAKWFTDLHTPSLEQLALGRFVEEGHLEKYISRVKKLYKRRRRALCDALQAHFPGQVDIWGASTGLHIVASFSGKAFTEASLSALLQAGVRVYPVEEHAIQKGRHLDKVIIGYGNLPEEDIVEGVLRMKRVLG